MLAYAAHRQNVAQRRSAPHALLVIIVAHIALIAAVMSARMDLPRTIREVTKVRLIPIPPDPAPQPAEPPRTPAQPSETVIDRMPTIVPVPQPARDPVDSGPATPIPTPADPGPVVIPQPARDPVVPSAPVRAGPRFATPAGAVRPPYPISKIASGEEAVLKLRLAIDARGRVTAVEPVGAADPAFLAAARRHLLARWRYTPATENGAPVASSTVITLRFELE